MTAVSLGKITDTAGAATRLTTNTAIAASKIMFRAISASTGGVFVGVAGMVPATGVGVIGEVLKPTSGLSDMILLEAQSNVLYPADYWVKPAINGEGVTATYWIG